MFRKYKKGIISLFLALAVMLSCCVPVFATIYENFYDNYKTYVYINESVQPYHLAVGKGGDFAFRLKNNTYFEGFFAEDFFIHTIYRDSSGNINGIQFSFTNYTQYKIEVNSGSSFILYDYNLVENSFTHNYNSSYLYKFDWSKFSVSMSCGIEKGDSFTYLNYQGEEETITFDGQGGIVGYGNSEEEDNPFGDLIEQDYPEFDLPDYSGLELGDFVNFDDIISSIQGLDVVGAVTGVLNALKGGFQYVTHSVINIVSHLALTLVSLFDWLKETLPILFGNMVIKLTPYFESLYNALKLIETAVTNNPTGEFIFDQEGLFGKLDNLSDLSQKIKDIFTENFINALLLIPDFKTSIETWFSAIETVFNTTKDKIFDLYDSFILFKDTLKIMLSEEINVITTFFDVSDTNVKSLISSRYEDFQLTFADKFPILKVMNSVKIAVESSFNENDVVFSFPDVTFPLHDGKTLTINGFTVTTNITKKIRIFTDPIIIGIVYLSTFNFFRNAIPDLIGGVGGGVHQAGDSISQAVYDEQHKNRTKIGF